MYNIVTLFLLVLVYRNLVQAAPQYKNEINENGYHFEYFIKGFQRSETGTVKEINGEHPTVVVGSYQFRDLEGNIMEVVYEADENGFRQKIEYLKEEKIVGRKVVQSLIG